MGRILGHGVRAGRIASEEPAEADQGPQGASQPVHVLGVDLMKLLAEVFIEKAIENGIGASR